MIYTAIAFFALAALLGMALLGFILKGAETPKAVVFTHGPLAATGLVLLAIYVFKHSPSPVEALTLFVITAVIGFVMLFRDLTGRKIPKALAIGHGLIAVAGFTLLLYFAFSK
jgi:hypothetical protein